MFLFLFHSPVMICSFSVFPQEMGVIGPNNQLPRRRAGRGRGGLHSGFYDEEDNSWIENVHMSKAYEMQQYPSREEDASSVAEALSLFPQPKSLLSRVIQVATSSDRIRVGSHIYGSKSDSL